MKKSRLEQTSAEHLRNALRRAASRAREIDPRREPGMVLYCRGRLVRLHMDAVASIKL